MMTLISIREYNEYNTTDSAYRPLCVTNTFTSADAYIRAKHGEPNGILEYRAFTIWYYDDCEYRAEWIELV